MSNSNQEGAATLHELNRRILENPGRRLTIIKDFYSERVKAGDRDGADIALLVRSMVTARESGSTPVPSWFPIGGFVAAGCTLVFLMALVIASVFGHSVPRDQRFLVALVFSLGAALATTFLGGEAAARGKIPMNANPLVISTTGGIAVLITLLTLLHYTYIR